MRWNEDILVAIVYVWCSCAMAKYFLSLVRPAETAVCRVNEVFGSSKTAVR